MTDFEPFDLARAEAGEPIMFRNINQDIRLAGVLRNAQGAATRLLIAVKDDEGDEYGITYSHDDKYLDNSDVSMGDIVMKPKPPVTKTFWACFDLNRFGNPYISRVTATDESEKWQYCIPFEFTLLPTKR